MFMTVKPDTDPEDDFEEREKKRLTEISRMNRIGIACFIVPGIGILIQAMLLESLSLITFIDERLLTMTGLGALLFGGTAMAYLLMFCIGFPAMMLMEQNNVGTLLNYILTGVVAGMVCNLCFWFVSIDPSALALQAGVLCGGLCWATMNVGNRWSSKRLW